MKNAFVAGTFDTKSEELGFIAARLRAAGVPVTTVDLGTSGADGGTDISAGEVAAYHPDGAEAVLKQSDRGAAVAAMSSAFEAWMLEHQSEVGGLIGAGGSGGSALVAPAMRALAVGIPKVLVSTVASGNVAHYVGASDISMMYSVTDVQGMNRISSLVLGNAAHSLAGMMLNADTIPDGAGRPAVGLTMFGVTTACVSQIAEALDGSFAPLVFHATGTGGRSMEKLVDSGMIESIIDLTTTEIADMIIGGVFPATDDRMGAPIRTGVPYVGSCGALDMVNFGARDTVPAQFSDRLFYEHNPQVTLMRTTPEENRAFGEWIAKKLNQMTGPVRFLIPEGGVSAIDAPGMPFHDPVADAVLFETIEEHMRQTDERKILRVPHNINTPEFANATLAAWQEITANKRTMS